jgi:lysophospholipase L1-like esterase
MDHLTLADGVGYHHTPGLAGTFWGAPVSIDSLGLRDGEISLVPPANEFRILLMGDSWPFGIGVRAEETFGKRAEQMLNERAKDGVKVRVVNMGVPSYNTEAEYAQWQTLGVRLHPRLVILMFSENDIEPKMWIFNKRKAWYRRLAQRSYLVTFLYALTRETLVTRNVTGQSADPSADFGSDYEANNPRWLAIDRSLTALHGDLQARGIPLVVFANISGDFAGRPLMHALCAREKIPMLELTPSEDPRWMNRYDQLVNSRTDPHPSALGHAVIAGRIVHALDSLGLVGELTSRMPR